jgi:hypothetical protein
MKQPLNEEFQAGGMLLVTLPAVELAGGEY